MTDINLVGVLKANPGSPKFASNRKAGDRTLFPLKFTPDFLWDGSEAAVGASMPAYQSSNTYCQKTGEVAEGLKAYELNIAGGAAEPWGCGLDFTANKKNKGAVINVQVSLFFPLDFDFTASAGGRLKFMRIHTMSAGASNEGWADLYLANASVDGAAFDGRIFHTREPFPGSINNGIWTPAPQNLLRGQWETIEYRIVLDNVPMSQGGTARTQAWLKRNGAMLPIIDVQNQSTLLSATSQCDQILLFNYWNGGAPKTQKAWLDRFVIHFTPGTLVETDVNGTKIIGGVTPP